MPALARHHLGIGIAMNWQDFRMAGRAWGIGVDIQLAEIPAEALLAVMVELLLVEEQHTEFR